MTKHIWEICTLHPSSITYPHTDVEKALRSPAVVEKLIYLCSPVFPICIQVLNLPLCHFFSQITPTNIPWNPMNHRIHWLRKMSYYLSFLRKKTIFFLKIVEMITFGAFCKKLQLQDKSISFAQTSLLASGARKVECYWPPRAQPVGHWLTSGHSGSQEPQVTLSSLLPM